MSRIDLNDLDAFLAVAREQQLHPRRGAARRVAVGAEPDHARAGGAARPAAAGANDAQRRADRSGRTADAGDRRRISKASPTRWRRSAVCASTPAGAVRISASEHAANSVLYPAVARLARDYPDIAIEVCVDNAFADIVAQRFDAGVRLGEQVEKDMVAVRVGPDMRMAIVGDARLFRALSRRRRRHAI